MSTSPASDLLQKYIIFQQELQFKSSIFEHCYLPNSQNCWQHVEAFQDSNELVSQFNDWLGKAEEYAVKLEVLKAKPKVKRQRKLDVLMEELKVEATALEKQYYRIFYINGSPRLYVPSTAMRQHFVKKDAQNLYDQCCDKLKVQHAAAMQQEQHKLAARMGQAWRQEQNKTEQIKQTAMTHLVDPTEAVHQTEQSEKLEAEAVRPEQAEPAAMFALNKQTPVEAAQTEEDKMDEIIRLLRNL